MAIGDIHPLQFFLQLSGSVGAEVIDKQQHFTRLGTDDALICRRKQTRAGDGLLEAAGRLVEPIAGWARPTPIQP
ncbi:MAG: hypothetical protein ACKOXO_06805 [Cyanobium sp.]